MGWASGGRLLEDVARAVMPKIAEGQRRAVAKKLIRLFESCDCDTIYEVTQKDVADAYAEEHPADDE